MIGSCNLVHSNGPYGENLAKGSSSSFSGTAAVNLWVQEKQYYNYTSNSCIGGNQCLHYTQVVWCNSVRLPGFDVTTAGGSSLATMILLETMSDRNPIKQQIY
ncbi:pathogenesis-related gene 1 [Euphorbia peplus]|nr:pathogenesis-related gene 1 [Euphorbia peplus]